MATLIKAKDGKEINIQPENGSNFRLNELYKLLNCELVEVVYLNDDKIMILDELGRLNDDWELNIPATELYLDGRMSRKEFKQLLEKSKANVIDVSSMEELPGCIAGDVIVCNSDEFR